jgi:hypothetical protein
MAVREVLHALGSFDFKLKGTTPRDVLDAIQYFGHIAILPGRVYVEEAGDNSLTSARYVGVVRGKKIGDDARTNEVGDNLVIDGVGIAFWLGDDDSDRGKGDIIEVPATFTNATFADTVRALLPDAVVENTIYSVSGAFTNTFQYVTPRTAIQYVCDTLSTNAVPVSWRVNGDASLDAGPESDLYVTDPVCVVLRKGFGEDMSMRALEGSMDVEEDMEDFSTRVVLLAEGEGSTIATGSADIDSGRNPYKDLHGNPLKLTRIASESGTSTGNAEDRAQLQLNRFSSSRKSLSLSADDYDVHGTFEVGDYIWVYDPDAGLVDTNNEIEFRGERLNPIKLQVHETSWSITNGYSIGYRDRNGVWYDLTDYIDFETQSSSKVTVGDFSRTLSVASGESVGTRPNADTSTPDMPTWVEPFQAINDQDDLGFTRSRVLLEWDAPNNTDGSTVLDGDHYEIQFRPDTDAIYPQSWASLSSTPWDDLNTWDQPFTPTLVAWGDPVYVAWGESSVFINGLMTGVGYDVRIRAVDTAGNIGAWRETTFVTTQDNIAPSTPAAPSVAGSRIALQVKHELGRATGGTFNLEQDLHHLEIHVDYEPHFTPSADTLRGVVTANQGMITGLIPAVQDVQVEELSTRYVRVIAVDRAGNKSLPSEAASADALLIDDAHISDLTVTKVTAGTISADWILGARIKTADSGARVELNSGGIGAWNSAGVQTVSIASSTGDVEILGQLKSGRTGQRLEINPTTTRLPEIRFYPNSGTDYGYINGVTSGTDVAVGVNSSPYTHNSAEKTSRVYLTTSGARLEVVTQSEIRSGGFVLALNGSYFAGFNDVTDGGIFYADDGQATINSPIYTKIGTYGLDAEDVYMDFQRSDGTFHFIGEMGYYSDPQSALLMNHWDFSGGASGAIISWGPTLSGTGRTVATLYDASKSSSNALAFNITAESTTGFTLSFAGNTGSTWRVNSWTWRQN